MQELWKLMRQAAGDGDEAPVFPPSGGEVTTTPGAGGAGGWGKIVVSEELQRIVLINRGAPSSSPHIASTRNFTTWGTYNPTSVTLSDGCWSAALNKFVVTGNSGSAGATIQSSDGITWTTSPVVLYKLYQIDWSPTLGLFACAAIKTSGGATVFLTSPDAVTWTERTTPANLFPSTTGVGRMRWVPELAKFVWISQNNTNNLLTHTVTSPDGINWTVQTNTMRAGRDTVYSPELGRLVAVGFNAATPCIAYTPDGTTWTNSSSTAVQLYCVTWVPTLGKFKTALNTTSTLFYESTDGITWTSYDTTVAGPYYAMAYLPWMDRYAVTRSGTGGRAELIIYGV